MKRLTEDDVRRIIREELAGAAAPVINIHNPAGATTTDAAQYVKAYTRLRPEERLRGAANSVAFQFTARELKRLLAILPGLQLLRPELDLPALVTEAKQILSDAAADGDE